MLDQTVDELMRDANPVTARRSNAEIDAALARVLARTQVRVGGSARRARGFSGRAIAVVGAAGSAVTGAAVAAIVLLTSTAAPAYAGWSAVPSTASSAAVATATAACDYTLSRTAPPLLTTDEVVLSEIRGLYTGLIYVAGNSVYQCVTNGTQSEIGNAGGLASSQGGYDAAPGADQLGFPSTSGGAAPGFPGASVSQPLPQRIQSGLDAIKDPSVRARWGKFYSQPAETHTLGRAGSDVSGVTFTFAEGSTVTATLDHGWYFAWWPNWDVPISVQLTTTSGQTLQSSADCQVGTSGCVFAPSASEPGPTTTTNASTIPSSANSRLRGRR